MSKAIITIVDEQDDVTFSVEFDPEIKDDSATSPAQAVAIAIMENVKLDGLEQTLAPFVENPEEEPQPQEKINE